MAAIKMYIDKFSGVVLIDEDHPLAVAQRDADAGQDATQVERTADTQNRATAPAASVAPPVPRPRKKRPHAEQR